MPITLTLRSAVNRPLTNHEVDANWAAIRSMLDTLEYNVSTSTTLQLSGGTMTGPLILNANPTTSLGAATKQYVDAAVSGIDVSGRVAKTGDAMTGPLTLSGPPTIGLHATTKTYVDGTTVSRAGATMTGLLTLSGDPTANLHAATKQYVDNASPSKLATTTGSAPVYGIRAWVTFVMDIDTDGGMASLVSVTSSGNVSGITETSSLGFRVNFSTPLPNNTYGILSDNITLTGAGSGAARSTNYYEFTTLIGANTGVTGIHTVTLAFIC